MSEIRKEIPFEFIMETDGSGLWTANAKDVKVLKLELWYNDEPHCKGAGLYGELMVYFDTDLWDTNIDGLIYTDKQFLDDLKGCLEVMALDDSDIEYSEAGMQGKDYVSLDVGDEFITSWTFIEWAASELPGN